PGPRAAAILVRFVSTGGRLAAGMTLAVEPPHPRLGSWNTPPQLSGKLGASPVHEPSQGLVQEPDLPADHDRAPRDPLAVTTGVEVLGLHCRAQGRHRGRVRPLLAAEPRCEPRSAARGDADVA